MKKIFAFLMALVLTMCFVACGTNGELKKPEIIAQDATSGTATQEEGREASIEQCVLVEEKGVKITAKSLEKGSIFGAELKLLIENNSGKNLTFQSRNTSVNGYMVETLMSEDVANGKKANTSLTFSESSFELCNITEIADMEFCFHIFTSEDWDTYLDTKPIQLKTSLADSYNYQFDDSGEVAYTGKDIKIIVKGLSENNSIFGPGIVVYLENNNKKNITVQIRDVSINGFMVDGLFSTEVVTGKRAVDTITFMSSDLEENNIIAIEDVELSFHIFETDGWDTIVDTDVVKIAF